MFLTEDVFIRDFDSESEDVRSSEPPQLPAPITSIKNTARVIDLPITRPLIRTRHLYNYIHIYRITNRILVAMFC